MFCEVSRELADEQGLRNGGWATITTARGEIECRVLVTARLRPLQIRGRSVHTIGLPYHWSYVGRVTGDPANELIGFVADPNVSIQESKVLTGRIRAGRHSFGRRSVTDGLELRQPELPPGEAPRDLPGLHATHRQPPVQPKR
jgi:formate dehydrogenase major subunit